MAKSKEEAVQASYLLGTNLLEQGNLARSLAAVGEGNWYKWNFANHQGFLYATPEHTVFFNNAKTAFTGDLGPLVNAAWRDKFLRLVTVSFQRGLDLRPLFEILDKLQFVGNSCQLSEAPLNEYSQRLTQMTASRETC